jgi:uncharacterized membrane protein
MYFKIEIIVVILLSILVLCFFIYILSKCNLCNNLIRENRLLNENILDESIYEDPNTIGEIYQDYYIDYKTFTNLNN